MKIILVANSISGGGAERQAYLIYKYLSKNHKVVLLIKNSSTEKKNWFSWNFENLIYFLKIFVLRFEMNEVNYILSIMPISHYSAIILKILFKAKLIISIRNDLRYYKGALENIYSFKFSILDYFVNSYVVQNYVAARLLKWKNVQKEIFVINNLLDIYKDDKKLSHLHERDGIVFIQRLDWQKDPLYMLELIKRIDNRIKISIYGEGKYLRFIKKNLFGLKNVIIYGKVQSIQIKKAIQQNLLGILTSFYEGMPNIIAEYILNGCIPVSTSNVYTDNLNKFKENNAFLRGIDACADAQNINNYYFDLYLNKSKYKRIANLNYQALLDFHKDKLNYSDWNDVFDDK